MITYPLAEHLAPPPGQNHPFNDLSSNIRPISLSNTYFELANVSMQRWKTTMVIIVNVNTLIIIKRHVSIVIMLAQSNTGPQTGLWKPFDSIFLRHMMHPGPKIRFPISLHCKRTVDIFSEHDNYCGMTRFTIRIWSIKSDNRRLHDENKLEERVGLRNFLVYMIYTVWTTQCRGSTQEVHAPVSSFHRNEQPLTRYPYYPQY